MARRKGDKLGALVKTGDPDPLEIRVAIALQYLALYHGALTHKRQVYTKEEGVIELDDPQWGAARMALRDFSAVWGINSREEWDGADYARKRAQDSPVAFMRYLSETLSRRPELQGPLVRALGQLPEETRKAVAKLIEDGDGPKQLAEGLEELEGEAMVETKGESDE